MRVLGEFHAALRACRMALQMLEDLVLLKCLWATRGYSLDMGIGIVEASQPWAPSATSPIWPPGCVSKRGGPLPVSCFELIAEP